MKEGYVLKKAKLWAKGESLEPLYSIEVDLLGEYFNIKIPKCFHHFINSKNPNCIYTTGAERTIFKTLTKIKNKLEELE